MPIVSHQPAAVPTAFLHSRTTVYDAFRAAAIVVKVILPVTPAPALFVSPPKSRKSRKPNPERMAMSTGVVASHLSRTDIVLQSYQIRQILRCAAGFGTSADRSTLATFVSPVASETFVNLNTAFL